MRPPSVVVLESPEPVLEGGRFPIKRLVGDHVEVSVDAIRPGSEPLTASICWMPPGSEETSEALLTAEGNDHYTGTFLVDRPGLWRYGFCAWTDRYGGWIDSLLKWSKAGEDITPDLPAGREILEACRARATDQEYGTLQAAIAAFDSDPREDLLTRLQSPSVREAARRLQPRADLVGPEPWYTAWVDRERAGFAAWYEAFPRSLGPSDRAPASFRQAEERLPEISELGFDVLSLPPIHPIGTTARRGRGNSDAPGPGDPGSPWAVGSAAGGHEAIDPGLGTLEDFQHFRQRAAELGLEIALDLAFQCSPDHPWVHEHPEWFSHRADGSIRYAENPPKRYKDIYPLDFESPDREGLWRALIDLVALWAERGVRIFRVDNPHTKPFDFWERLIREVHERFPDTIFLSEAFTRPKIMYRLARLGFSESYTYFTWRNSSSELREYFTELSSAPLREYFRPMLFVNTPDILSPVLQRLGRPAFEVRAVLAATLSPLWGVYSGYEFLEREGVEGSEEYRDSEKYRVVHRDPSAPGNLRPLLARLNRIRHEEPALRPGSELGFFPVDNAGLLGYYRKPRTPGRPLLVIANVLPERTLESLVSVPLEPLGLAEDSEFRVRDLLTDRIYTWKGRRNYVKLDPGVQVAHILRVEP